jgi:hypothetical protein
VWGPTREDLVPLSDRLVEDLGPDPARALREMERSDPSGFEQTLQDLFANAAERVVAGTSFEALPEVAVLRSIGSYVTEESLRASAKGPTSGTP